MKTIRKIVEDCAEDYYPFHEYSGAYEDDNKKSLDQALKEIETLLVECKQHIPNGVEEFKHTVKRGESTWVVDRESYNLGQDDYIKNIKELL